MIKLIFPHCLFWNRFSKDFNFRRCTLRPIYDFLLGVRRPKRNAQKPIVTSLGKALAIVTTVDGRNPAPLGMYKTV